MRIVLLVTLAVMALPALADYSRHSRTPALLETLADQYGFSSAELQQVRGALQSAQRIPALIEAEKNAAEKTETWTTYARKRVDPLRIRRGALFLREQQRWLLQAEAEYGVPPAVIAGILGLETNYGGFTGKARVLDSLATQGFDHPTRAPFFMSELVEYFVFCRDFGRDPTQILGSYAGAMGWAQFMPSNYRRLAVDFDGDGIKDLWSAADAIGSVAHYLSAYDPARSWQRGQPLLVGTSGHPAADSTLAVNGKLASGSIAGARASGLTPAVALPADTPVGLIELQLDEGREYWLGLHNFYSVMSYNPRVYYAMTVARLAQEITQQAARDAGALPR